MSKSFMDKQNQLNLTQIVLENKTELARMGEALRNVSDSLADIRQSIHDGERLQKRQTEELVNTVSRLQTLLYIVVVLGVVTGLITNKILAFV